MMHTLHYRHEPLLLIMLSLCFLFSEGQSRYDICVYGGSSAGVVAACAAARLHKSVLLVAQGRHLGGLTSGGLGNTDIGNKFAITGIARNFYRRLGKYYGKFEQWTFEPHVAEKIFDDYLRSAHVTVLYDYRILRAEKKEGNLAAITVQSPAHGPLQTIRANIFIDCSYEGDLLPVAGVSYTLGRESNDTYGETYNGVELRDKHQFPNGVDPYRVSGDPASGLLWGISPAALQSQGSGDSNIQSYNYRICLTDDPANRIPIIRPPDYDSTHYELLVRLMKAQPGKKSLHDYFSWDLMPNRKTDINNNGAFSTDMIGMNDHYPEADFIRRSEIVRQHEAYTRGLLYFIGHDTRVPDEIRREMAQWGYPKDEYADNNHWTPQLYVRESRRMVGEYVMTEANCEGTKVAKDGIGLAAYTMDSHNCQRIVVHRMVKNEGDVQVGGFDPYPVSYRSLVPRKSECTNLLVPVCLSASHIAYGSIRMEPVFMVLGESAAVAASLAIDDRKPVQEVDVQMINRILNANPELDGTIPEILVDVADSGHVTLNGQWTPLAQGGYRKSYLTASENPANSARFNPEIKQSGSYSVYVYLPGSAGANHRCLVEVNSGSARETKLIHGSRPNMEGPGEWIRLGRWRFRKGKGSSVVIRGAGGEGVVAADALLFVAAE